MNSFSSKEKNTLTVDLTNDEKIVFSQLGINPLIKLGKEYLTSNNFVRLKDKSEEKDRAKISMNFLEKNVPIAMVQGI